MQFLQSLYIKKFKKLFDSNKLDIFLEKQIDYHIFRQKDLIKELIFLYKKNRDDNFTFCKKDDFFYPFLSIYLNTKKGYFFDYKINEDRIQQFLIEQREIIENNKQTINHQIFLNENKHNPIFQSFFGCIFGAISGDAFGAVLEFQERHSIPVLESMSSGGIHNVSKGEWTDDSSMLLCLMQSIIDNEEKFDLHDQINNYQKWYKKGFLSTRNYCFDIGISTRNALDYYNIFNKFKETNLEHLSGNGSIMRLAPVPLYYNDYQTALNYSLQSSLTTHQSELCLDGCLLLSSLIHLITYKQIKNKDELLYSDFIQKLPFQTEKFKELISFDFLKLTYEEIPNSGFVLDTLISAIWCFYHTDSYKDSIIKSANLCGDADTIACVCGQISGAFYGFESIPKEWLNNLHKYTLIFEMSKNLYTKSLKYKV